MRVFNLEMMEGRRLLAAAITSAIADAIERVSDRSIYDKAQLNVTRDWAVRADVKSNPAALATKLGAASVKPSGIIDGVFIATFARSKLDRLGGEWIGHAIDKAVGEGASWPLVATQQSLRAIPNDPRFANQWHLRNTGQGGGVVGADANIVNVWDQYKGNGVVIGIVDDGVTPGHQDLAPNYLPALSYDFNRNDPIPDGGDHGTSVAGVAAGRGDNGVGGSGAAPLASIAGLQLIDGSTTDTMEANALSYLRNDIDIYSNSWGPNDNGSFLEGPGPLTLAAFTSSVTSGRGGLGNIYTWAGGNGGDADNANFDGYANSRYIIAVGALTNSATRSSYSERGSNILVSAYSSGGTLGIDTTAGSSNTAYTTSFGGTSSATPLVSGVIALMLQANPGLTWRDVQHILAKSAEKVSAADAGWSNNGAGLHVNDKFGFGGIDAAAAVALAQTWSNVAPEISATSGTLAVNAAIPDNNLTGVTRTFDFTNPIKAETVEVVFNATHTTRGQLQVLLTSPSGTQSLLAAKRTADSGDNFSNWTFSTKRILDEDARGTWTIKVTDETSGTTGTFVNWKMNVYGTALDAAPSISGTVYADLNGSGARDGDEAGTNGVTVWADLDLDSTLDAGEPSAVTNANGAYTLTPLSLGSYTVRAIAPASQFVTEAAAGRSATLTAAASYSGGANFGVVSPSVTGVAFDDADVDGVRDSGEAALAGATIFNDANSNSTLDSGEASTVSGADGVYRLSNLTVGSPGSFRVVAPAGRRITSGYSAGFTFTPVSGAYVAAARDVGVTTTSRISGYAFDDLDRNGFRAPGVEPGLAGVRVFIDSNDNGIYDDTNYDYAQNTPQAIPDDRVVRYSDLVVGGAGGVVNNLNVRVNVTHSYIGDLDIFLISPAGTRVELTTDNGGTAEGFNVTFSDSAASLATNWGSDSPVTGTWKPEGSLATLNGQSLTGTWRLEITDDAGTDAGVLNSWSIYGGFTERSVFTDANGAYAFDALSIGTYKVRQVIPAAPYALESAAAGLQVVTAVSGSVYESRDFANINTTTPAPAFVSGSYAFDAATPAVELVFNSAVVVEPADLVLSNLTSGQTIPASAMSIIFNPATSTASITFPTLAGGVLPDGNYQMVIGTGVSSPSGVPLAASATSNFYVLAGDANRDRSVDFADLVVLSQNYNLTGRAFSQGDFNYSGTVDFQDLVILSQRYNTQVPALATLTVPTRTAKQLRGKPEVLPLA
jgi:subtilisin-like proprotein convertase family protein